MHCHPSCCPPSAYCRHLCRPPPVLHASHHPANPPCCRSGHQPGMARAQGSVCPRGPGGCCLRAAPWRTQQGAAGGQAVLLWSILGWVVTWEVGMRLGPTGTPSLCKVSGAYTKCGSPLGSLPGRRDSTQLRPATHCRPVQLPAGHDGWRRSPVRAAAAAAGPGPCPIPHASAAAAAAWSSTAGCICPLDKPGP